MWIGNLTNRSNSFSVYVHPGVPEPFECVQIECEYDGVHGNRLRVSYLLFFVVY
jgi:hypothetical protein